MEDRAVTYGECTCAYHWCAGPCPSCYQRKRDEQRRKIATAKSAVRLWWHGVFWGSLHALGFGWAYSRLTCKLGLYQHFRDGRCMFCGNVHTKRGKELRSAVERELGGKP
jgi:hypothetical protein